MVEKAELAREKIVAANEGLAAIGHPYKLDLVDPKELVLLDKNARFMPNETFKRLVENIKEDGNLQGTPFCWKRAEDGKYVVLSGNHRVKSALATEVNQILIMFTDENLSREKQVAIQLAHNAIAGQDDLSVLKSLWEEIEGVNMKQYAGLDDKTLEQLSKVSMEPLSEVRLDFRQVSILFLPEEYETAVDAFKRAMELLPGKEVWIARHKDYDRTAEAIEKIEKSYNIRNMATCFMILLQFFEKHQTELQEGWDQGIDKSRWIPLASIFGTDSVPLDAARVIQQAVERIKKEAEMTEPAGFWRTLELMSGDYLGKL